MTSLPDGAGANPVAYMVGYTLDHAHRVVVGIRATSAGAACAIAQAAFDAGTLWDDTPDMPLLYDDYEELPHWRALVLGMLGDQLVSNLDDTPHASVGRIHASRITLPDSFSQAISSFVSTGSLGLD